MKKTYTLFPLYWLIPGLLTLTGADLWAQDFASSHRSVQQGDPKNSKSAKSLKAVLAGLEKSHRASFAFRDGLIENKLVSVPKLAGKSLEEILDEILPPLGLQYKKMEDEIFVIQPADDEIREIGQIRLNDGSEQGFNSLQQSLLGRISGQTMQAFLPVRGKVTDENGESLPGVNVLLNGTANGAVTDAKGTFSLNIPADRSTGTLTFSFVGYTPLEIPLNRRSVVQVNLKPSVKPLSEIVVIGYGTLPKSDLTGSVVSVQRQDFGNRTATNVGQLLEGRVAGVDIARTSGGVDANPSIKVRGTNSLSGTDPLWIINGMPGDPNMLNPNDIESIDVLKDASSTAIYGARGANGVFIVTTRKAKPGRINLQYQGLHGVATPGKKINLLNAFQYADLVYNIKGGAFNPATVQYEAPAGLPAKLYDPDYIRTTRTDWQDEILKTQPINDHHLSLSGGRDFALFRVSLGYQNQGQTGGNKVFNRLNLLVNSEYKIGKFIRVGENLAVRQVRYRGNDPDFIGALRMPPSEPVFSPEDGNPGDYSFVTTPDDENDASNPVATMELVNNRSQEMKYALNVWAEVTLGKILTFRSQFSYERSSGHWLSWHPAYQNGNVKFSDELIEGNNFGVWPQLENFLTFSKGFGKHNLTAMVGNYYFRGANGRSSEIRATGFKNFDVLLPSFGSSISLRYSDAWRAAQLSYFGRINYTLLDRYLFTFNMRADGSDKFAPANRWGIFPSFAAAWKLKEEKFLQSVSWLDELKLRASWGKSGSDAIGQYRYYNNVFFGGNNNILYAFGDGSLKQMQTGATINSLATPDIRWESTTTSDIGLDLGLWRNALNLTIDYYHKLTDGILIDVPVPASTGIDQPSLRNAASVTNRGFDFTLSYRGKVRRLGYSLAALGGYNQNRVQSLGAGEPIVRGDFGGEVGSATRTEAGYPIGYFWGYKTNGVISTLSEAEEYNSQFGQNAQPGDLRFQDLNGDGKINDQDRTNLGNGMPLWTYGFNLGFNWKSFDLTTSFQGMYGNKIFNHLGIYWMQGMIRPFNASTEVLRRWKQEGDITDVPWAVSGDPNRNLRASDRYIEDGSYLRLQTFTLGYSLPKPVLDKLKASTIRLFFTSENLRTWTNYTGYHTDVYRWGNFERGIDTGTIPLPRTFTGGLQVGF